MMLQRCWRAKGEGYQKRRKGFQICRKGSEYAENKGVLAGGAFFSFSIVAAQALTSNGQRQ